MGLCMLVSAFPVTAFAALGDLLQYTGQIKTSKTTIKNYNQSYEAYVLENDYIRVEAFSDLLQQPTFYVRPESAKNSNPVSSNAPNVSMPSAEFYKDGKQISSGFLKVFTMRFNETNDAIVYTLSTPDWRITATMTLTLVELNPGFTKEPTDGWESVLYDNENLPVNNPEANYPCYGVKASFQVTNINQAKTDYDTVLLNWNNYQMNFSRMGHPTSKQKGSVLSNSVIYTTSTKESSGWQSLTSSDISNGIVKAPTHSETSTKRLNTDKMDWFNVLTGRKGSPLFNSTKNDKYITEVYSNSYAYGNPFILTGDYFYSRNIGRLEGHSGKLPETVSYDSSQDMLYTTNSVTVKRADLFEQELVSVIGYRDLYEAGDEAVVIPSDNAEVSSAADKIYVYKDGDGYKVTGSTAGMDGSPAMTLRGMAKKVTDNSGTYYEFTSGKAALSSSVTATWKGSGCLRIYTDGRIEQKGVNLNCPKFKFYSPADDDSLNLSLGDGKITAEIDPDLNKAVISVDIPNTTVKVDSVDIISDGNIVMGGEIAFKMLFGSNNLLTIEKLGYGMENSDFKCNGIQASGSINTASMLGLDLAEIEGEINTFKGEERCYFSLELNAFDLFETEAELELKRFGKTGDLMPNKLWFYINAEPGIPLVPPVVVGNLTGGGGGVTGLADSFNGDFIAIPPIRFKIKGTGDFMKLISGSASVTVGPMYAQWSVEDIKLAGIAGLLTEYETHIGLTGTTRSLNGTKYTGLNANGGMSMKLEVPEGWNVIEAGGSFDANVFGGLNNWKKPTSMMLSADANGNIYGKLKFPKNWKLIGGRTIAKTNIDFALGGFTSFTVRNTSVSGAAKEALKNMKFYFGAAKTGSIVGIKYRIYYIAPKTVGHHTAGWGKKLKEWNLRDEIMKSENTLALIDSDGAQVGFVTAEIPFEELRTVQSDSVMLYASGSTPGGYANISMEDSDPLDTEMMLLITPNDGMTEEFKQGLRIYDTNKRDFFNIVYAELQDDEDGNQIILNEDTANAMVVQDSDGKDAILVNLGVQNQKNNWEITNDYGDFSAALNYSSGLAEFEAALNGDVISASVNNPASGANYVMRVYYGSRPLEDASEGDQAGVTDYFAGEFTVTDPADISEILETSGTLAPSGDYVVNAYLMEKFEEDFDADGKVDEAYVTIGSKSLGSITYTNTLQPDAPAGAAIKSAGNEVLHAEWSEVSNADGYQVTIYEKDENGDFIETSRGYKFDSDEFSRISGLGYDSAAGKFTLDMALTNGGEGDSLSADKTYRIGVKAFRYMTDDEGNKIDNGAVQSAETLSNEEFLPEYVPLDISVDVSFDGTTFIEADFDSETGLFSFPISSDSSPIVKISAANAGNVEYSLIRTDNDSAFPYESSIGGFLLDSGAFEGSLMLRAQAVNTDSGDVTTKYITVYLDDCAPLLTFDNGGSFIADPETGAYTVTGQTEAGAVVVLSDENRTVIRTEADGSFSFDGTLDKTDDPDTLKSIVTSAYALDQAGNLSDEVPLMITGGKLPESPDADGLLEVVTVTFDSKGGSEVTAQNVYKFRSAAEPEAPAKTGYTFVRWELDGAEYDFSAEVTENITLSAVWTDCTHENNTNPTSCTEETICSVCGAALPPTGHKDADSDGWCDVCGKSMGEYIVSFETDGGTAVKSQTVNRFGTAAKPADPAKTGYIFGGWYSGSSEFDFSTKITDNLTLTAKWTLCGHSGNTNPASCTKDTLCSVCAGIIPPAGHKDADSDKICDVCGANLRTSGGSSGGHIRPTKPSETKETLPMIGGKSLSWEDIAKQLEKLPMNGSAVIDMCGLTEVPQAVAKVIADRKLNVEFRLDSAKSRTVNGAEIAAPAVINVGIMQGRGSADGLRGTPGFKLITESAGVPAGIKLYFRSEFAGQFANLYRVENGRNVFVSTARISADGSAEFTGLGSAAEYIVMAGLSALPGDANNDGQFSALDASAILKDIVGAEKLPNPGVSDLNGDGRTDALDASAMLKKIVGR